MRMIWTGRDDPRLTQNTDDKGYEQPKNEDKMGCSTWQRGDNGYKDDDDNEDRNTRKEQKNHQPMSELDADDELDEMFDRLGHHVIWDMRRKENKYVHDEDYEARKELQSFYDWQDWERDRFEQTGSILEQMRNGDIHISQPDYADTGKPISITRPRRNADHSPTTDYEKSGLRALLGAVLWRASQGAPWLSCLLSHLLSEIPRSLVRTLINANRLV